MFVSQDMGLYKLIVHQDSAFGLMSKLGQLESLEFIDQQPEVPSFNKYYSNQIRRLEQSQLKLLLINETIQKQQQSSFVMKQHSLKEYYQHLEQYLQELQMDENVYLDQVEQFLQEQTRQLEKQINNLEQFKNKSRYWTDQMLVLDMLKMTIYVQSQPQQKQNQEIEMQGMIMDNSFVQDDYINNHHYSSEKVNLSYFGGIVDKKYQSQLQKMVFRISKGNAYTLFREVNSDLFEEIRVEYDQDQYQSRIQFLIVYQSGQHDVLKNKLQRAMDSLNIPKMELPTSVVHINQKNNELINQNREIKQIIDLTRQEIDNLIDEFICVKKGFNCSFIVHLQLFINKKIEIFKQLNNFQIGKNYIYQCECWCPKKYENEVLKLISRTKEETMICGQFQPIEINKKYKIPTYFETNELTDVFQEIVNTYGIPRYKEINPALFTIVTFPFLFGVMYGDIGHGSILLSIGLYIHKSKNPMVKEYQRYKWLIMLMGFFSIYTGFIYNDFLCISLNLFGSCYNPSNPDSLNQLDKKNNCNYGFGLDPAWTYSQNDVAFTNSMKMKISVIIGFVQMTLGIVLKGLNNLISRNCIDFLFEFVPQLIFMVNIFGYMCYLIFMKWSTYYADTSQAFSIITLLINNPLSYLMGTNSKPLTSIEHHQLSLLLVAVLMVPIILFVKPVWLIITSKRSYQQPNQPLFIDHENINLQQQQPLHQQQHNPHSPGDIFVHQIIETIEFVLGSISNTASYLRLWALSLAHNQLSKVFFANCLLKPIQNGNFIGIMIGYIQFAGVTFGVIVCMDTMECFLHSLRLHWVEFQNKFYKADGTLFQPYTIMKTNQQKLN